MPLNPANHDFWFAWDGEDAAILGRQTFRPVEVTERSPTCETFVVRTLRADGGPGTVIDFFWSQRQPPPGCLRPLTIPPDVLGVEVCELAGTRVKPLVRFRIDRDLDLETASWHIVFLQAPPKHAAAVGQPFRLRTNRSPSLGNAESFLSHHSHEVLWAIAAPHDPSPHPAGQQLADTEIVERRVGPLRLLRPHSAELIAVQRLRYGVEGVDTADAVTDRDTPAIQLVAREPNHVIAIEIDVPPSEVSRPDNVPGLFVIHTMRQRELIALWDRAAQTALPRFRVGNLETVETYTSPFPRSGKEFLVKAVAATEDATDGIRICGRDAQSDSGRVRCFELIFDYATLGDYLTVYDHWGNYRLSDQAGRGCNHVGYRVGSEGLVYLDDLPEPGWGMIEAAQALDAGYVVPHLHGEEPARSHLDTIAEIAGYESTQAMEFNEKPLLPLVVIAYDAHTRHDPTTAERISFDAFQSDPGVMSAVFLSKAVTSATPPSPIRFSTARSQAISRRLAAQLGAFDLISLPDSTEADLLAADSLTRTDAPQRMLWENASAVGVKVDLGQGSVSELSRRLSEFRDWLRDDAVLDEIMHSEPGISGPFHAYRHKEPPYRPQIAAPDFDALYTLVRPIADAVMNAGDISDTATGAEPRLPPDRRSTQELRADVEKLIGQALMSNDASLSAVAQQIQRSGYTLRKHLRTAEKTLKDRIGAPAISSEILILIDRLETWAALNTAMHPSRGTSKRRDRIVALARAVRGQGNLKDLLPMSDLGRAIGGIPLRG